MTASVPSLVALVLEEALNPAPRNLEPGTNFNRIRTKDRCTSLGFSHCVRSHLFFTGYRGRWTDCLFLERQPVKVFLVPYKRVLALGSTSHWVRSFATSMGSSPWRHRTLLFRVNLAVAVPTTVALTPNAASTTLPYFEAAVRAWIIYRHQRLYYA